MNKSPKNKIRMLEVRIMTAIKMAVKHGGFKQLRSVCHMLTKNLHRGEGGYKTNSFDGLFLL